MKFVKKLRDIMKKFSITDNGARAAASIGVCLLGGFCMYITNGTTGVGWAILGIMLIWG